MLLKFEEASSSTKSATRAPDLRFSSFCWEVVLDQVRSDILNEMQDKLALKCLANVVQKEH